jgi:hypothetical protein
MGATGCNVDISVYYGARALHYLIGRGTRQHSSPVTPAAPRHFAILRLVMAATSLFMQ